MSPLFVRGAADSSEYPSVIGFKAWLEQGDSDLKVGDRLVQLADKSLLGLGPIGVASRFAEHTGPSHQVDLFYVRDGREAGTSVVTGSYSSVAPVLPVSCAFFLAALVIRLRAPPNHTTQAFFLACMSSAIAFASYFVGGELVTMAAFCVSVLSFALAPAFLTVALWRFPDDRPVAGVLARLLPVAVAFYGPLQASNIFGVPISPGVAAPIFRVVLVVWGVACLVITTRNYLRTDPIGRRQLRWFMFGAYAGGVPAVTAAALAAINPTLHPVYFASLSATALFPACILISIVRYNLFDIDRLISTAASYNVLAVGVVGFGLVALPRVGDLGARFLLLDPAVGQVAFSLLLAWAMVECHRRLRPRIEKVFFPERYRVDNDAAGLLTALSDCANSAELTERVGAGVSRLMRPDVCVIYGRQGESYEPTYVSGRAVPPIFGRGSSLIDALQRSRRPMSITPRGDGGDADALRAFDRAAIATIDARVIIPVFHRGDLASFVCLGPKRSGDIYTPIDLTMFAAVADKLSSVLERFDDVATIEEARAMHRALRRYVPGAVAEQLASGHELGAGAREVSVLFVDIRGYTAYSADRPSEEVFSTINQYTKAVSVSVRRNGGNVVEFNGDGMMAVFGAPNHLPTKERAAVEAAKEILVELEKLPPLDARVEPGSIPVGIGIATGEAFVGSVQASDRMIWTALGSTVNLAARLQSLSKELGAAIIVDHATWHALENGGFSLRRDVQVRGFARPHDVYTL